MLSKYNQTSLKLAASEPAYTSEHNKRRDGGGGADTHEGPRHASLQLLMALRSDFHTSNAYSQLLQTIKIIVSKTVRYVRQKRPGQQYIYIVPREEPPRTTR